MKKQWTEQVFYAPLQRTHRTAFDGVTLTDSQEPRTPGRTTACMVDYELRSGQVDCVLRR